MKIKAIKGDVFIPPFGDKDIKVHYHFLTEAQREQFIAVMPAKFVNGEPIVDFKQDKHGLVLAMVDRIENLTIDLNGTDVLVDEAQKLYDTVGVPVELIRSIEGEMSSKYASTLIDKTPLASPGTSS